MNTKLTSANLKDYLDKKSKLHNSYDYDDLVYYTATKKTQKYIADVYGVQKDTVRKWQRIIINSGIIQNIMNKALVNYDWEIKKPAEAEETK